MHGVKVLTKIPMKSSQDAKNAQVGRDASMRSPDGKVERVM